MYGFLRCPVCAQPRAERSRTRGLERLLKPFTTLRPDRCGACGWRGWCRLVAAGELRVRPSLLDRVRARRVVH